MCGKKQKTKTVNKGRGVTASVLCYAEREKMGRKSFRSKLYKTDSKQAVKI